MRAAIEFAFIAGVVLPFLPDRDFGPFDALNARHLWLVVVVVTGLSFLGYISNRLAGARRGTFATAVIGGLYSSTAVTLTLARRLRNEEESSALLSAGIAIASALMLVRTVILTAIVARFALYHVALALLPATIVAGAAGTILLRRGVGGSMNTPVATENPIQLLPAFGFLALVAVATIGAHWANGHFGEGGIAGLLLATGILDVDAATVTLGSLEPGSISPAFAGPALAAPLLGNTLVKASIVFAAAGRSRGRMAIACLLTTALVLALSIATSIWLAR